MYALCLSYGSVCKSTGLLQAMLHKNAQCPTAVHHNFYCSALVTDSPRPSQVNLITPEALIGHEIGLTGYNKVMLHILSSHV